MPQGAEPAEQSAPALTQEVFAPGTTPPVELPVTPMVHVPAAAPTTPATPAAGSAAELAQVVTASQLNYRDVLALGNELVRTGFLPEYIQTGAQAAAIILAGHEIGVPAMKALRSIKLVKGQVVLNADLQLGIFKSRGGRARFRELTDERAVLDLVHPNGDPHTEIFTMADARRAGLLNRSPRHPNTPTSYEKFPRPMLRSRCITAGLNSLGFEELAGAYDPDEAKHFDGSNAFAFVDEEIASQPANGSTPPAAEPAKPAAAPSRYTQRIKGSFLDEKHEAGENAGEYVLSDKQLDANYHWALDMSIKHEDKKEEALRFVTLASNIELELQRRDLERATEEGAPAEREPGEEPAGEVDSSLEFDQAAQDEKDAPIEGAP